MVKVSESYNGRDDLHKGLLSNSQRSDLPDSGDHIRQV